MAAAPPRQGTAIVTVKSPAADIEQLGDELKQDAQLGADVQADGRASHEYWPARPIAPPTVAWQ